MRIGKPLLISTTAVGVPIGIYEGFTLAGAMGFVMVALIALFGAAMVWVMLRAREESRAERKRAESQRSAPEAGA